jgi:hypothetical protein
MTNKSYTIGVSILLLLICGSLCDLNAQRRRKRAPKPVVEEVPVEEPSSEPKIEVIRLKLADGTYLRVDDAWQSGQSIWYKLSGITHLADPTRVKAIDKSFVSRPTSESTVSLAQGSSNSPSSSATNSPGSSQDGPAWIYLVGGARFEADSAVESKAGVWYRRGPLAIFIERSRIDRIEREDLESLAKSDSSSLRARGWSTGSAKIDSLIRQNAAKFGVDPYLIFCVMEQESHFNPRALSPKGARGLMQLMPGTAARFGVRKPHDPAQNIAGGTRYLKQLLTQFRGRVDLVLASYNAGEGAVIKYGHRVPPYRETRAYVKRISFRYKRAKSPINKPPVNKTSSTAVAGGM